VAAVANEVAMGTGFSLQLHEEKIPATAPCRYLAEMLGLELLDIANEGKMLFFVSASDANRAVKILRKHSLGRDAAVVGEVLKQKDAKVYLKTRVGGEKILGMPVTEPIPRIC